MSTNRAARALARAERVANQPPRENQPPIEDEIDIPAQPIVGITNTDKYPSDVHFNNMLQMLRKYVRTTRIHIINTYMDINNIL